MRKKYLIIIGVSLLYNCNSPLDKNCNEYYDIFYSSDSTEIIYTRIQLDTIKVDSAIEWSLAGNFWIRNDTLCLSDLYFGYIYRIDYNGAVIDKQVGFGRGTNEAVTFRYSVPLGKNYILYSSQQTVYYFDNFGNKLNEVRLGWCVSREKMLEFVKKSDPANSFLYEDDFGIDDMIRPWSDHEMVMAITASLENFNGYFNTNKYYNYSRLLAVIDIYTGKIVKIFGRRSPLYLEKKNLPNFDHFCYDVLPNAVLLSFYIDPKIYALDRKGDKALYAFGVPGREMNTNWPLTLDYHEAEAQRVNDEYVYGYYTYLKYDAASGLLFRGYQKGSHADTDGLQIYKDKKLIADMDVPKGFKMIGSINHEFYAQITDESEIPYFYRFSLIPKE